MITKEEYNTLVEDQKIASRNNDYSTMIMMGDKKDLQMKEYFRSFLCKHEDVGTNGGGDYCKLCGKQF